MAELIRQRLAVLGPQAGEVLRIAAVIGREFDPGLVSEVGHAPLHALDQAVEAGLVTPSDGRLAFTHDLVRESLVKDIPPLRKAAVHRSIAAALAARPGSDVEAIAHHAVEAGPAAYQEAVRWAAAAAEQGHRRLAYEEAASWWGRAVFAHGASAGDPETHVELLLRQVHALLEAGDAIGARQARAEAVRIADRAAAPPELAARALTALDAPALWLLRDPYEAVELRLVRRFETALEALGEGDSPERARLLGGLAQELYDGSGDPRGDELSAQAVAMARRLGDPHLLMRMLNARYLALLQPLHIPELLEISDELYDLAVSTRTPRFELLAQMMRTHNRLELFDVAGADRAAARCEELLERLPLPWSRLQHTMWSANRFALDGRFDDAETQYDEAERQAERIGMWYGGRAVVAGRLLLSYRKGAIAEAGPLIEAISGIHPTMDHDARVLLLSAQGRVGEARMLVRQGRQSPPRDWSWLSTTCLQAAAQAVVGDVSACRTTYSALLPYAGRISAESISGLGPVDWYLALLADAMDDSAAATAHLSALERLAERNGLTWWYDRARAAAIAPRRAPEAMPAGPRVVVPGSP
ncbi:hypothetical protein IMZ11_41465 [Microtetraspora sp. AC03309]|nr:hypothetical protein [Microtetraspora sp. AC03309]